MGWAEIDATHGTVLCPVCTAVARDVSVVALDDHADDWYSEADGTLQDLCHLHPQVGLPRLCFLHPALHGVKGLLQYLMRIRVITLYLWMDNTLIQFLRK